MPLPPSQLSGIPPLNRSTWEFVADFLVRVNQFESINMMTDNNLAIVFAPNILRPKVSAPPTAVWLCCEVLCRVMRERKSRGRSVEANTQLT